VKIRDGRAAVSVCSEGHSEIPEAPGPSEALNPRFEISEEGPIHYSL